MDDLDLLDMSRYDVEALVGRANAFERMDDRDQDATDLWEYSGLGEAEHPLTSFLPELHNTRVVVRDLDGSLSFVFEDLAARVQDDIVWDHAPLIRQNLVDDEHADRIVEELGLDRVLIERVLNSLPSDPSHSLTF